MSFNIFESVDKANLILRATAKQQEVTGTNLANIHTPGYEKQEISFNDLLKTANSPLETKLSKMFGPSPLQYKVGGKVNVSDELINMQKNLLFYSLASRRVTSVITELRTISQLGK